MTLDQWLAVLVSTITAATPLIYGALGVLVCERAGVLNLGVEACVVQGVADFLETSAEQLGGLVVARCGPRLQLDEERLPDDQVDLLTRQVERRVEPASPSVVAPPDLVVGHALP